MWSTKKPATDASNPIALNANLHECLAKNGLHGGTTAAFDQGKASQQNAEYHFVACGLVRSLTIVLALHARISICCVTQAFPVPSHQLLTGDQESGNEEEVRGTAQP